MSLPRIHTENGEKSFAVRVRLADRSGKFTKTVHVSAHTPEKAEDHAFSEVQCGPHVFEGFVGSPTMIV